MDTIKRHIKFSALAILLLMVLALCPFAASAGDKPAAGTINMNFDETPLPSFVKFMSKTLGKNIVADPSVSGVKVSIVADKPVSKQEAKELMLSVFDMNNLYTMDMGDCIKVVSAGSGGKVAGLDDYYGSDGDAAYNREQEQLAIERSRQRLEVIKAYISSPVIPFEVKNPGGLKTEQGEGQQQPAVVSKKPSGNRAWNRFLHKDEAAPLYAVINSGSVINAMLITGVNSDLPGNMVAQVSENVYDSPTGKRLLIPQGSRLFGVYDSKVLFGQRRPLIKWTKLIYPDGSTLDLLNMPGTDRRGYAGFKGKVNNHYWPMLTSAAFVSIFAAVADYYDNNKVVITSPTIKLGSSSLPVGSMVMWPTAAAVPDGWLLVDGSTFNETFYPDLQEVLGSTTLPSMNSTDSNMQYIIKASDETSAITALAASTTTTTATGASVSFESARNAVGRELGKSLQQMATKLLDKYLEMAPTLTVQPGYKFAVIVNKEVELPVKLPSNNYSADYVVYDDRIACNY